MPFPFGLESLHVLYERRESSGPNECHFIKNDGLAPFLGLAALWPLRLFTRKVWSYWRATGQHLVWR